MRLLLADAQTSGGLLCCVPAAHLDEVLAICEAEDTLCRAVIGKIGEKRSDDILITVN